LVGFLSRNTHPILFGYFGDTSVTNLYPFGTQVESDIKTFHYPDKALLYLEFISINHQQA
jgi:hypothetical protein